MELGRRLSDPSMWMKTTEYTVSSLRSPSRCPGLCFPLPVSLAAVKSMLCFSLLTSQGPLDSRSAGIPFVLKTADGHWLKNADTEGDFLVRLGQLLERNHLALAAGSRESPRHFSPARAQCLGFGCLGFVYRQNTSDFILWFLPPGPQPMLTFSQLDAGPHLSPCLSSSPQSRCFASLG